MYSVFVALMEQKGVSAYEVSKATGIHQSAFSKWKAGISKPNTEKMVKLADYFGVPVEYILARSGWASDYVMKTVYRGAISDEARKQDEKIADHFSRLKLP